MVKEVTAVIELRARFDEESNIEVTNLLQKLGRLLYMGSLVIKPRQNDSDRAS